MKKRVLALLLAVVTVSTLALSGCGEKEEKKKKTEKVELETLSPAKLTFGEDDYAVVAKNDSYEMKMNATATSIQVTELANGNVWDTQVSPADIDVKKVNKKWIKKLNSPFEISCTDLVGSFGDVLNYSLGELKYDTKMESLENGVRVHYDLKDLEIKVAVDYKLTADGINVTIPDGGIDEYGKNSVTSIKMFPYFASATDKTDGYYFYPDGSGAIMEFKDISHFKESDVALDVYGDIFYYNMDTIDILAEGRPQVMLPVFGANIGDNGFVAIIEDGDEAAQIKIASTNNIIPVNSLSCEFVYRRSFVDLRIEDGSRMKYDDEMITGDRTISYRFLEKGNATYSDMAGVYRDYLIENGVTAKEESKNIPLYLELFMAIQEEGFIADSTIVATSFDEAEDILKELDTLGVKDIDLQLRGWTKNGYYTDPVQFPVNGKAGGSKGLKNLLEYTTEKNIDLFLATNLMEAREEAGSFNAQNDVMYIGNSAIWQSGDLYVLSPDVTLEKYNKLEKDAAKYGINGVSFLSVGNYLSYNYNTNNYITKGETAEIWKKMLNSSTEKFGSAITEGGNAYVLGSVERVMDIPMEDSGYQITTKSVPFYQLAVHGLVEYTGLAGNLSSDLKKDSLKWAEFGYTPYFELTHSGSEDLMYTDYNTLYSSTYSDWIDDAASIYVDFNENLTSVRNAYMERHEEVAADVFKVTYSNGEIVYVNYNEEAVTVDGNVTVEAESYVVKKG